MPKIVLTILIVAGILIFIMGISFFFLKKILGFGPPKPKSDVKIVYKIAWWAYQKCLTVDKLETKVLNNKLNLFNSRALVEYSISGNLKYRKGWKPFIKSVFISERWMPPRQNSPGYRGDIQLIPLVGVKQDDNYNEEKTQFTVKVQDYLHSGGWGKNIYYITSQKEKKILELQQLK
jgi:hypothetical protein